MTQLQDHVRLERSGSVVVLIITHPPVNALSDNVRRLLLDAVHSAALDRTVTGMVVTGEGRTFIAGADLREMDLPLGEPSLPALIEAITCVPFPMAAAINGACLGGGLELAMACDLRIAAPGATLGLPETRLGLVPGAGGTQRLPRLVGIARAAEMIAHAEVVSAAAALEMGLVDDVAEQPLAEAICRVGGLSKRQIGSCILDPLPAEAAQAIRRDTAKTKTDRTAAANAIDLVLASSRRSFEEGLDEERKVFLSLRDSETARALRYLFRADRAAASHAGSKMDIGRIKTIGVVGGGTMGAGIALAFASSGFDVILFERNIDAARAADVRLTDLVQSFAGRRKFLPKDTKALRARLLVTLEWPKIAECHAIVEAVFEDEAAKKSVYEAMSRFLQPEAIVATNTSYLDIDRLALSVEEPSRFLGLHFFAPAHAMKLVEVVRGMRTTPDTVDRAVALVKKLGKTPVVAGNSEGFIGNRIFSAYRQHMEYLVEDGADPATIDQALEAYGFAMGPFQVFDLSGLDVAWAMRKRRAAARDPRQRYVSIADHLCEAGHFGRKSGVGWYDHSNARKSVSAAAKAAIDAERNGKRITPRHVTADEIVRRMLVVMVNEGAKLLEEGVAARASDTDVVMTSGYGFPRARGGPMFAAGRAGLASLLPDAERAESDAVVGSDVAALLRRLAEEGSTFGEMVNPAEPRDPRT